MLRLNITWQDRRVKYLNIRNDIYQNLISDDEAKGMWIPEIGKYIIKKLQAHFVQELKFKK